MTRTRRHPTRAALLAVAILLWIGVTCGSADTAASGPEAGAPGADSDTAASGSMPTSTPVTTSTVMPVPTSTASPRPSPIATLPMVEPTETAASVSNPETQTTSTTAPAEPVPEAGFDGNEEDTPGLRIAIGVVPTLVHPSECDLSLVAQGARYECGDEPEAITGPGTGIVVGFRASPWPQPARDGQFATVGSWSWTQVVAEAPYVVIDHGPIDGHGNVTSIVSNLTTLSDNVRVGISVSNESNLGSAAQPRWSVWIDDQPAGNPPSQARGVAFETERKWAEALAESMHPVVDDTCPLVLANTSEIPNADRSYRSGVHAGIDFVCAQRDQPAYAAMDGTVLMVVDGYVDPQPFERSVALGNAAAAGLTPRWTLNMLYGNFVILGHEQPGPDSIAITIYAHLAAVDPAITPGSSVVGGQVLGVVGNLGTSAAANRTTTDSDRSLHLHWEIHIDDKFLGEGLGQQDTVELYRALLCSGGLPTAGCG